MNDAGDAGERFDARCINPSVIADEADGGPLRTRHWPRFVAHLLDDTHDAVDLFGGCAVLHDYQHQAVAPAVSSSGREVGFAPSTAGPRMRTLTSEETPGSCIVTPYTASAASVVVRGL